MQSSFDYSSAAREPPLHQAQFFPQTHKEIRKKIVQRFDTFIVPRNITINDLCLAAGINLVSFIFHLMHGASIHSIKISFSCYCLQTLTNGSGFYKLDFRETVNENRKIILRNVNTGEYFEDFTSKKKGWAAKQLITHLLIFSNSSKCSSGSVRRLLRLPEKQPADILPKKYPQYEVTSFSRVLT